MLFLFMCPVLPREPTSKLGDVMNVYHFDLLFFLNILPLLLYQQLDSGF